MISVDKSAMSSRRASSSTKEIKRLTEKVDFAMRTVKVTGDKDGLMHLGDAKTFLQTSLGWNNLHVHLKKLTNYDSAKKRLAKNSRSLELTSCTNLS